MITQPIENFDFFPQFSILAQCIEEAGTLQLSYVMGADDPSLEEVLLVRTSKILRNLRFQKRLELFPDEKRKHCIILTELSIQCIRTLLRIPALSRIYAVREFDSILLDNAQRSKTLSSSLKCFSSPQTESERFSAETGELILMLCIEGLTSCKKLLSEQGVAFVGVKKLLFKDLLDEFSAFYSLSIRFTHCGLLFPF